MLMMTQLAGFGGRVAAASPPPALTLAFQSSATATGTDNTVTGPADIIAGDLLVLQDCVVNDVIGAPPDDVPTGFTRITTLTDTDFRFTLSYKIATGAEASANLQGLSSDLETLKTLVVFRPSQPIAGVTVGGSVSHYTAADPSSQLITAGSGTPPLLVIGSYQTSGVEVSPRTFSTTPDAEIQRSGVQMEQWIAWKFYVSAPANTTIDMDDEGSRNALIGAYLAIT